MTQSEVALLFSGAALAISICGFIWSIWKEFIFVKPRVKVSFGVMDVLGGLSQVKHLCVLNATNMGPGPVHLYCCLARQRLNWRLRAQWGLLNPIQGVPTNLPYEAAGPFVEGLPLLELEAGKSKSFYFPYQADCFLKEPIIRVGVQDTYGRNHWCHREAVAKAKSRYDKEFVAAKAGRG